MKVYIAVDMEGATGVCSFDQLLPDAGKYPMSSGSNPRLYSDASKLLTGDVNAAVEGAFAGGAAEVIVADVHSSSFNLVLSDLDPRAKVVYGVPHKGPRFPYLDKSVDLMFLVAYHAKSGTMHATIDHTICLLSWSKAVVNGKEIGEVGMDAGIAGSLGIPVVLVTGDDKVCSEARELLGDIETAEVKKGVSKYRALCLHPKVTREIIFEAAKRAMTLKGKIAPLDFGSPVEVSLTYKGTEYVDGTPLNDPNVCRVDGTTVVYRYKKFSDWSGGL